MNNIQPIKNEVEISNCLSQILKNPEKSLEIFNQNLITNKIFCSDPWSIISNQNIIIKYNDDIYPIKVGLPILLAKLIYKSDIPDETIKKLYVNKSFFGIKTYNLEPELKKISLIILNQEKYIDNKNNFDNKPILQNDNNSNPAIKKFSFKKKETISNKIKSLSPSTSQIKLLNLNIGKNEIKLICHSRLSGEQTLSCELYLWDSDAKIVISDVDGTITKSDVLGHIMPIFGNDWAQRGVTELFNSIEKNGYKILYLTARAICQSSVTKNYLKNLTQNNCFLPKGPLVMSPDGLFTSFKREVIDKTPQVK